MATEVEDDDAWLYGDSKKAAEDGEAELVAPGTTTGSRLSADAPEFEPKERVEVESGELSGDEQREETGDAPMEDEPTEAAAEQEDEDEDSDDDVQVTIGDIKSGPVDGSRLFKGGAAYQRPAPVVTVPVKKPQEGKGIDVDATGAINGVQIYEFDLETVQEKPWLKPGADLTDYFNYGFTEESWRRYCEKQRSLRMEYNPGSLSKAIVMNTHSAIGQSLERETHPQPPQTPSTDENKNPNSNLVSITGASSNPAMMRRGAPPPRRKYGGTIDVIGSTERDSRRPSSNYSTIPVTGGGNDYNPQPYGAPVSTIPSHSGPPPTPDFSAPPPMIHQGPPPGPMPGYSGPPPPDPNIPPPQYGGPPPGYYPPGPGGPPPGGPPPNYDYYGNQQQPTYSPAPQYGGAPPQQPWDGRSPGPGGNSPANWDYSGHPGNRSPDNYRDRYRDRERSRSRERDRPERRFREHKDKDR